MKRVIMVLLCILLVAATLSACDGNVKPDQPAIALAIIVGRRACSNDFTDSMYSEIREWVGRAVYGGYISVIVGDGEPLLTRTFGRDSFPESANSTQYMNGLIEKRTNEVIGFIHDPSLRAIAPEADLLGAIVQAERSLYADEASGLEKRIIIMDSGLPTAGFLNLQKIEVREKSAENGDIETIVSDLKSVRGILPDLTGISSIKWVGLGNVAYPQRLPNTIGIQIEELWRAVLRESGAVLTEGDIRIKAAGGVPNMFSEDEGGFPSVTTIFFDSYQPEHVVELSQIPKSSLPAKGCEEPLEKPTGLTISSEQVPFMPDQAVYANEEAAFLILQKYAEWLKTYFAAYPGSNIYVVGFMANTRPDDNDRLNTSLSEQRAETVKGTLVDLGVSTERLVVMGIGINGGSHFRVDEFPNGVFDTVVAQQNRKVMLLPDISYDAALALAIKQELDSLRS